MNALSSTSLSDNRKSAIQNPKWLGLSVIAFMLLAARGRAADRKIFRIGFLTRQPLLPVALASWRCSRQEMRKLGWIEGKNITIEYRFAEQKA